MKGISVIKAVMLIAVSWVCSAQAVEPPLTLDVYQADSNSFYVSSVLVTGKTEAALIDAQFTRADAHQIVARILRSGKKLTTIYISHGDPDYYFGLEVITQAFPQAKVYATEKTREHIQATVQKKLAFWGPKLGANGPSQVVLPERLPGNSFTVDGEVLNVVGLEKHPAHTYVWIPSIKAVVGGVPVYNQVHLWIADAATQQQRQQWLSILESISALRPETVIAGHAMPDTPRTLAGVMFTRHYLLNYEKALASVEHSKALIRLINQQYPDVGLPIALEIGAKVATGEMQW